ncbi:hypothetical protein PPK14_gp19 [Bacillus phage vB_BspS_SplendidRed]|uniref:Uncharacterized protein n=1 Tax=Bacillus phage vB_BspS_SplendidRed TaxID=2591379 RepID=A0A5B9NRA3_9CAUD|nr:hypothetical protein PPK14_gp19 [Bacillus phage vB_BspS_SplendidRed]QEG13493.1 hypothetical protein SPLENDIDRED_19 [Bacillus phage vB_BspS_SplendidRed]
MKKDMTIEEKYLQQCNNPFYQEVDTKDQEIKEQQWMKAAKKYPRPFSPDDWTPQELLTHFLQENYDQRVYGVALGQKLEDAEKETKSLRRENEALREKVAELEEIINELSGLS